MYAKEVDDVIIISPNGRVITFANYLKAKVTLNKEHHENIIKNTQGLCLRFTLQELKRMLKRTLELEKKEQHVRNYEGITDKAKLAEILWPMLITQGYRTIREAFGLNPVHKLATHVIYYSEYIPKVDQIRDLSYLKLTPQAAVLVDMIADKITPRKEGVPFYQVVRLVNQLYDEGKLKTKQAPIHIWDYYKAQLITRGFLIEVKPKSKQRRN